MAIASVGKRTPDLSLIRLVKFLNPSSLNRKRYGPGAHLTARGVMVITCPLGTHLTAGGLKVMDPRWGGRYDREGAEGHGPDRGSKFKREGTLYSKIMLTFQLFAVFKIRLIFEAILVPTWLHFGRVLNVLGASGRLLGRLRGILAASFCKKKKKS